MRRKRILLVSTVPRTLDDTPTFVRSRILYSPSSPLSFIRFADTVNEIHIKQNDDNQLVKWLKGTSESNSTDRPNSEPYLLTTVSIWIV